ncbi:MAG: 5'-methylthioadenosine/adenosylhomocysteine nucleosidase [Eubacteriales bacterium]|jgi:adenosylhomocysteine nucleosidase|nr:5'-methylthioadenosine/adenosylhomocysteine nucleosidase [Clostridiales bacterium]
MSALSKTIGIIGAMDIEINALMKEFTDVKKETVGGTEYIIGDLYNCRAVAAVSGIGKIAAAVCANTMIIKYGADAIINTGTAGALISDLAIGDVVVAKSLVEHDVDLTIFGYAPGEIPGVGTAFLPCDETLVETAIRSAKTLGYKCHSGIIASGDAFICDSKDKERIKNTFGASACEMEGAAIARVCRMYGVPCAVVRCISDTADDVSGVVFESFKYSAAQTAVNIVSEIIKFIS